MILGTEEILRFAQWCKINESMLKFLRRKEPGYSTGMKAKLEADAAALRRVQTMLENTTMETIS